MRPYQLEVDEQYWFVADLVRGLGRVLEVGCGRGDVARLLTRDVGTVTAIDLELRDPRPMTGVKLVEGDFLRFDDFAFDAIVFTASLHHIHPLDTALDRAAQLLVPGGLLILDEFDLDAPKLATARWLYETLELLAAAGLYPAERIHGSPDDEPRMRWLDAHVHDPPLATGRQMLAAVAARFAIRDTTTGPYLYRYACRGLPDDEQGGAIAQHVLATERRRIANGSLDAAGLRAVAVKMT
ncbi:MAG TPA: class I SAM-dependent methyltransferase [Kofleriaceae bacterium]|nr:class I SAM-dependent methyltransferase [Kofleriaceae bacterium]